MLTESSVHRCCTFLVGDACFAVPADGVVEVLRAAASTRVPRAPPAVQGLVHLRGRIVPVVDPAVGLGIDRPSPHRATLLVLAIEEDWYALAIDEMLDVLDIPAAAVEHTPPPADDESGTDGGIYAGPERLVHLLDPMRMIHSLLRARPQASERQGVSHGRP